MSKGIEALKGIEELLPNLDKPYIKIIEKELKRLEELENMYSNCVIEGAKQKKALEIIKKKKVNIFTFYECCSWHNASHYNDSIGCPVNYELTNEEYNLLKEVML